MSIITNKNDINFLISHTGLKEERLNLLLEEDSQVILESASTAPFEHSIVNISFPMFVKLSILQIKETRKLLIGICFLDAPRFRENCFCAGFINGYFALPWAGDKPRFRDFSSSRRFCRATAARRQ